MRKFAWILLAGAFGCQSHQVRRMEPDVAATYSWHEEEGIVPSREGTEQRTPRQEHRQPEPSPPSLVQPAAEPAPVRYPYHEPIPDVAVLHQGVASQYAQLSPGACRTELQTRKLPFRREGEVSGVASPVRFAGPLDGIEFRVPPDKSPYGRLDCRLALVLASLTSTLREHQVSRVRIDNFHRPGARLPTKRTRKSQHNYALAADVVSFTLEDGRELDIKRDFHGKRGAPVCGPEAYLDPPTEDSILLRNLVCAIARLGAFHHILTPNYDAAHEDHLHLDIKRDNRWFSVR